MVTKLIQSRIFKFLVGGGIACALNLVLIFFLIDLLRFDTAVLRNVANALSIEISLIASFFIYRIWVWPGGSWCFREVLWRQLPLYHMSSGLAVLTRILIVFPFLDWLGIDYAVNTLVGVSASAIINYLISDRFVFKYQAHQSHFQWQTNSLSKILHPEGLSPALVDYSTLQGEDLNDRMRASLKSSGLIELLSVVIPAHNEEGCISNTVKAISELLKEKSIEHEILVVNDNSYDRTKQILRQLRSRDRTVRYINNYYPNGFGFAVRCGLENFHGDAVAIVMADGSDAPENIIDYYYKLREGYDCVFGSRFIKGGKTIDYPSHKLVLNRLANIFIQILFGLKFNDTTNAFKIYRREVIEGIAPLISHHFNLTVEMPLKAISRGYSYAVIPISWQNRTTGISKLKVKEMGSRYLFIVLSVFLEKMLARRDYVAKHPRREIQRQPL